MNKIQFHINSTQFVMIIFSCHRHHHLVSVAINQVVSDNDGRFTRFYTGDFSVMERQKLNLHIPLESNEPEDYLS